MQTYNILGGDIKVVAKFRTSATDRVKMMNIETNLLIGGVNTKSRIVIRCFKLGSNQQKIFAHFSGEAFFGYVQSETSSAANVVENKIVYMFGRKSGQEITGVFALHGIG